MDSKMLALIRECWFTIFPENKNLYRGVGLLDVYSIRSGHDALTENFSGYKRAWWEANTFSSVNASVQSFLGEMFLQTR